MNIAQTQINIVSDGSWQDLQQLDPQVFKIQFKFILVYKAGVSTSKT
jgi:predicted small secreted protein